MLRHSMTSMPIPFRPDDDSQAVAFMKTHIAAITSTLYDLGNPLTPASQIYLAMDMDLDKYLWVADVMRRMKLAKVTSETIQLTDAGMEVGKLTSEILAGAEKGEA